ncbi:MAG: MOSC N-terminal beta barrel domain-containing protein [Mycobacteriales bacterium]
MSLPVGNALLGTVASLHRYPVKSLVGEDVERIFVNERGLLGDRLWSVRDPDGKFGSGKSSARFRKMDGLLALVASYDGETPVIAFPDGRSLRGDDPGIDDALSEHVGRPVALAQEEGVSHFDDGPFHLITTSGLRWLSDVHGKCVDARHFRPNLVLATDDVAGPVEQSWIGRRVAIGDELIVDITDPMPRCVMVTMPQAALPAEDGLLRTVTDVNEMMFGVLGSVVRPGTIAIGDRAELAD